MKKEIKILMGVLVVLLTFLIYKFYMLQRYKAEKIIINNDSIFNETINITHNKNNNKTFNKMSYYDYFSDYVSKENTNLKVKYNNGEVSSFYAITEEKQYINNLSINSFKTLENEENNIDFSTEKNMKKFLEKNKIKDDIDLLKYIKDNYYIKSNLLTNTKTIKNNYIINSFIETALPNFESMTLIKGDNIKGYIINVESSGIKNIHLLYGDTQYIITLGGEEITTTEFINNLLETISFE